MTRNRALLAMFLAVLLGAVLGRSWRRHFGSSRNRALMTADSRSFALRADADELRGLRPGDRVDVLAVFDAAIRGEALKHSATILQNVMVLGTGPSAKPDGRAVVYLMLNPVEAQYAALASRQGDVVVALRRPGDREMHPLEMSDFRSLFR